MTNGNSVESASLLPTNRNEFEKMLKAHDLLKVAKAGLEALLVSNYTFRALPLWSRAILGMGVFAVDIFCGTPVTDEDIYEQAGNIRGRSYVRNAIEACVSVLYLANRDYISALSFGAFFAVDCWVTSEIPEPPAQATFNG